MLIQRGLDAPGQGFDRIVHGSLRPGCVRPAIEGPVDVSIIDRLGLHEKLDNKTSLFEFCKDRVQLELNNFFLELQKMGFQFDYPNFLQMPFYEGITFILRGFDLLQDSDTALQYFLDEVFEYQRKKRPSIEGFLEYWEQQKEKSSAVVPESTDAVRIMTIHKAKGLEFPVVIFPYDLNIYFQQRPTIWYHPLPFDPIDSVQVSYGKSLELTGDIGKSLFERRRHELEFDNFNLLYVTFTRAVEQLYVIAELKESSRKAKPDSSSAFLIEYLKERDVWDPTRQTYGFGSPKRKKGRVPEKAVDRIELKHFRSSGWDERQINVVKVDPVEEPFEPYQPSHCKML